MVRGDLVLTIPNPHKADIGPELIAIVLRQDGITRKEWESVEPARNLLSRGRFHGVQPCLGAEDVVSFRRSQQVVTQIDLRVHGADYSVPLECAGGLRDVRFETAELSRWAQESERAEGTFALFFDLGAEQVRRAGQGTA
jgi:hypothetical protein